MKKRIWIYAALMLMSAATFNVYAMGNGFYLGLMGGYATNTASPMPVQVPTFPNPPLDPYFPVCANGGPVPCTVIGNPRHNQFATRIYMGNQFSPYAAIEGGLLFISSIQYDTGNVETFGGTDLRVRGLDVVGKGIFPFGTWPMSLYGKAGMSVLYVTTGGALNPTYLTPQGTRLYPITSGSNTYKNKFAPTFSIGASYDINQSWQTDLSFNAILVGDNVKRASYIALGFSYHFTDKFCGQFLCDD